MTSLADEFIPSRDYLRNLGDAQDQLEILILRTPTSEVRNQLTELNIKLIYLADNLRKGILNPPPLP